MKIIVTYYKYTYYLCILIQKIKIEWMKNVIYHGIQMKI
jgi:hypothetical protein